MPCDYHMFYTVWDRNYCLLMPAPDPIVYFKHTTLFTYEISPPVSIEDLPTAADLLTRIINTGWCHCTVYHRFYIDFICNIPLVF